METRYKMLALSQPEAAKHLLALAQQDAHARYNMYQQLANMKWGGGEGTAQAAKPAPAAT
jgi:hypothetical protein